jgi:hypothetical protein
MAMQIFLDANPQYWRFVPMSIEQAQRPEQESIPNSYLSETLDSNLRSKQDCSVYVEAVPKPPHGFIFSTRQQLLQTKYFHYKQDQILPNLEIDLYDASIIAICKFFSLSP